MSATESIPAAGEAPSPTTPSPEILHPAVAAALSAFLLWLAFPPADRGYLAWLSLAPFFATIRSDRKPVTVYLASWIGGLVFGFLAMSWVSAADLFGMLWMALFMSIWWPLFLLPARVGVRRLGLPMMAVAPVVWVGLEYARAHILSGFPWYYLAHSQYAYLPMIQVCDLAGAWGLSLIVAIANAWGAEMLVRAGCRRVEGGPWIRRPQVAGLILVVGLIASTLLYGGFRLMTARFRPGPRIALLQSDFPQALKNGRSMREMIEAMRGLVVRALNASPLPALIVWPETSYPIGVVKIDPALSESRFAEIVRAADPETSTADWRDRRAVGEKGMRGIVDGAGVPMLVGTATYDFRTTGLDRYNSAVLYRPDRATTLSYHKQSLVPFGEYIPFVGAMPWLLSLTPYTDGYVPSLSPGAGPERMELNGVTYAPIICFEDTIPHVVRAIFWRGKADVLVNLTNDGWFRGTPEHQTHLAIAAFRCVETRTPMVRAVNTGISAMIDGNGRIHDTLDRGTWGVLIVEPPLDGRRSLYLLVGDVLPLVCLVATFCLFCLGPFRRRRPSVLAQPHSVG